MVASAIGFAGDLQFPSGKFIDLTGGSGRVELKTLLTIGDLFLIHDVVFIRADKSTLMEFYNCFTQDEVDELLLNNRLKFYPPIFYRDNSVLLPDEIGKFFTDFGNTFFPEPIDVKRLLKQVFDNMLERKHEQDFEIFDKEMKELFYKHGIQRDSFFSMDVQVGFNQSLEKVRELWACDIRSMNFDREVLFYFGICEKAAFLRESKNPTVKIDENDSTIIDQLHSIKGLPSLGQMLIRSDEPNKLFLEVVNSTEADNLRKWLQSVQGAEIDVRDLYIQTTSKLPSKNQWLDWLRFGGVSAFSGILTTLLTHDPVSGFMLGSAIGSGDKIFGDKFINQSMHQYNPDTWFSFLNHKISHLKPTQGKK